MIKINDIDNNGTLNIESIERNETRIFKFKRGDKALIQFYDEKRRECKIIAYLRFFRLEDSLSTRVNTKVLVMYFSSTMEVTEYRRVLPSQIINIQLLDVAANIAPDPEIMNPSYIGQLKNLITDSKQSFVHSLNSIMYNIGDISELSIEAASIIEAINDLQNVLYQTITIQKALLYPKGFVIVDTLPDNDADNFEKAHILRGETVSVWIWANGGNLQQWIILQ